MKRKIAWWGCCAMLGAMLWPVVVATPGATMPLQLVALLSEATRAPIWLRIALVLNTLGLGIWLPRRLQRWRRKAASRNNRVPLPEPGPKHAARKATSVPMDIRAWLCNGRIPPAIMECPSAGGRISDAAFLERLYALLCDNDPAKELTVAAVASTLHLSRRRLERRSRQFFCITPRQLLIQARLYQSLQLLSAGNSIKVTALMVGFSTQQNFSRFFKQNMGVCPVA